MHVDRPVQVSVAKTGIKKGLSFVHSLPKTPEQTDILFQAETHIPAEILARRDKRRAFKITMIQHPEASQM